MHDIVLVKFFETFHKSHHKLPDFFFAKLASPAVYPTMHLPSRELLEHYIERVVRLENAF